MTTKTLNFNDIIARLFPPQTVPNAVDNGREHNVKLGISILTTVIAFSAILDGFWVMIAYFSWYTLLGGLLRM